MSHAGMRRKKIEARERARQRLEEEEKLKDWVQQNPDYIRVRHGSILSTERRPQASAPQTQPSAPEPGTPESAAKVRAQIVGMIKENLSGVTEAYNRGMQKEAEMKAQKKTRKGRRPRPI